MDEILDNVEKRGIEKGFAEGFAEGFKKGFEKGLKKGENKLALLMEKLLAAKRYEDADEATTDTIKRNQLYKEFGIQ